MNLDSIKQRDRWSCKKCGHKYNDLEVLRFCEGDAEGDYITLCKPCLMWSFDNKDEAVEIFKRALFKNKVVFVGDCHGHFDKLDQILTAEEPFNFFISVGDFATADELSPANIEIIGKWRDRGYFVAGNHDDVQCLEPLALHHEVGGLIVCGLNGMIRNKTFLKETPSNISFSEVLYLSHLSDVDILVSHQAPTGVFNNMGEPVLEELLNYLVPKIYIFGHTHKFKFKFHLNTFMISLPMLTSGHAVAYFQGRDLRNLELIFRRGKKFIRV